MVVARVMGGRISAKRLVLLAVLILASAWLLYSVVTTNVARQRENAGDAGALAWRPNSPAALSLAAGEAASRQDYAEAEAYARRALDRQPLGIGAIKVLARVAVAKGRTEDARRLMRFVGARSLRDTESHAWIIEDALSRGEYREALRSADALMRRSDETGKVLTWRLLSTLSQPAARDAIAEQLATNPPWREHFMLVAAQSRVTDDIQSLYRRLALTKRPPTRQEGSWLLSRLVMSEQYEDALSLWAALTRQPSRRRQPFVYDGEFKGREGPEPLNWQFLDLPGGQAGVRRTGADDQGGVLVLEHDGFSSSGPMARQLIFLPSGAYTIGADARVNDPQGETRFRLEITCATGAELGRLSLRSAPDRWERVEARFEVPAEGCDAQWVSFRPESMERSEVAEALVDNVRVIADVR